MSKYRRLQCENSEQRCPSRLKSCRDVRQKKLPRRCRDATAYKKSCRCCDEFLKKIYRCRDGFEKTCRSRAATALAAAAAPPWTSLLPNSRGSPSPSTLRHYIFRRFYVLHFHLSIFNFQHFFPIKLGLTVRITRN